MQANRKLRLQLAVQSALFVALFLALVMLVAFVAGEYRKEWDVTRVARNSLSQGTLDVLRQLDGAVSVTAYAVTKDAAGNNIHKAIEERFTARAMTQNIVEAFKTVAP